LQQEISQAVDAAMRKYHEITRVEEKSALGVANAMGDGAKERAKQLTSKMQKLLSIANPKHGLRFLQEVMNI